MSRVANKPITIESGVNITQTGEQIEVKGSKGALIHNLNKLVNIKIEDNVLSVSAAEQTQEAVAQAGTARSILNNLVIGVTKGFEKKLTLIGVGYRAQAQGSKLNLSLGFSHPVDFALPEGITAETPSQTEIVIKGINKQLVGEVAAKIRAIRPPEPYKGKGVRYADEYVAKKETKKK